MLSTGGRPTDDSAQPGRRRRATPKAPKPLSHPQVWHRGTVSTSEPGLLADLNPLPTDLDPRLRDQLTFLIEIDKLKTVVRRSRWLPRIGARTTRSTPGTSR